MLALSPKQKSRLGDWVRPCDFMDNPQMILAVSSFSIKQVCFFLLSSQCDATAECLALGREVSSSKLA